MVIHRTLFVLLLACFGSLETHLRGVGASDDAAEYADYVNNLKADIEKHQLFASEVDMPPRPQVASKPYQYSQIFLDNIVKRVPLKGSFQSALSTREDLLEECVMGATMSNKMTQDVSLIRCDKLMSKINLPKVLANNYISRIIEGLPRQALDSNTSVLVHTQWPAAVRLAKGVPTPVGRCPLGMHQLVFPVGKGNIKIRFFTLSTSSRFDPVQGDGQLGLPMHHVSYKKTGFPKMAGETGKLPKHTELTLDSESDFAFIPENLLASFMLEEDSSGSNPSSAMLCKVCFVDASNLNTFREEVALNAKISSYYMSLSKKIEQADFDLSMEMNPSDFNLRENTKKFKKDHEKGAVEREEERDAAMQESASASPIAPSSSLDGASSGVQSGSGGASSSRSRRSRGGATTAGASASSTGTNNFREWQEVKKWDVMIRALTMQPPAKPTIIEIGRTNVTIEWPGTFLPDAMDTTLFGFNLTVCPVDAEASVVTATDNCTELMLIREPGGAKEIVDKSKLNVLYERVDEALTLEHEKEYHIFTLVVGTNLQTDSYYRLRLLSFYDESPSSPSPWSVKVRTAPYSPPSQIPDLTYVTSVRKQIIAAQPKIKRKRGEPRPTYPEPLGSALLGQTHSVEAVPIEKSPMQVTLSFLRPLDDGDDKEMGGVLGYYVYARARARKTSDGHENVSSSLEKPLTDAKWLRVPYETSPSADTAVERLTVKPYYANSVYEFRVGAFNAIGDGPLSAVSNQVYIGSPVTPTSVDTLTSTLAYQPFGPMNTEEVREKVTVIDTTSISPKGAFAQTNRTMIDSIMEVDTVYQEVRLGARQGTEAFRAMGWRCHWSARLVAMGNPVWVYPVLAESTVQNADELLGRIALVLRGEVPIVHKIRRIQEAGATGIVLIDDGSCTARKPFDQNCIPGSNKADSEGFSAHDLHSPWETIRIPVVFIHTSDAKEILTAAGINLPETFTGSSVSVKRFLDSKDDNRHEIDRDGMPNAPKYVYSELTHSFVEEL